MPPGSEGRGRRPGDRSDGEGRSERQGGPPEHRGRLPEHRRRPSEHRGRTPERRAPGLRLGWSLRPGPPPPHRGPARHRLSDLVGPDDEVVAGRWPVREAFVAGREARRLLVVPHRRKALEDLVLHAVRLRIPIVEVEGGVLTAVAGFDGHQGIALVVAPRRSASLDEVLARAIERREPPFVLVLDALEDPQNLGTLLRSAEGAGVHGVVVPKRRQAPLSPAAVKASAGATEHLLIAAVDDLPGALADLHVRGVRVVGAEAEAPLTYREADLRGPIAVVVGSEGQGLSGSVRRRCDLLVRIPLHGAVESLNAAVAGAILLFEARAQRGEAAGAATAVGAATAAEAGGPAGAEGGGGARPEDAPRREGAGATEGEPGSAPEPAAASLAPGPAEAEPSDADAAHEAGAKRPGRRRARRAEPESSPPDDEALLPGEPPPSGSEPAA